MVALTGSLHKGYVGVVGIGKGPSRVEQIAPLGAVPVVGVEGGPEALEQQALVCAAAVQNHPEPEIACLPDGLAVAKKAAAGGLLVEGRVKAVLGAQLQARPRLCRCHKAAHGGFRVLPLDDGRAGPLGQNPGGRVAAHHEVCVLVLVGAAADAHGDAGRLVAARQPPALGQQLQILGGGPYLQGKAALRVIRAVPVKGHPHVHPAHTDKGVGL